MSAIISRSRHNFEETKYSLGLLFKSFLPASVVPLDIDELSDSVVSGRFSAGSSVVWDAAAGGPDGLTVERRRWRELPRGRKQEKHFHNVNTYTCIKLILLQNLFVYFLTEGGGAKGYILYVVLGGSAALVELISIVELILTGGIGEVWHRV